MRILNAPFLAMMIACLMLAGCGTPKEKTAPCKRSVNLASYAPGMPARCGPMRPINIDPHAVLAVIGDLPEQSE